MRIERMYIKGDGEDTEIVPFEDASATWFVCTDTMPDGQEFGIQMQCTPAVKEMPVPFMRQAERAMDEYRRDHGEHQ